LTAKLKGWPDDYYSEKSGTVWRAIVVRRECPTCGEVIVIRTLGG
jgi:hypothetical protein